MEQEKEKQPKSGSMGRRQWLRAAAAAGGYAAAGTVLAPRGWPMGAEPVTAERQQKGVGSAEPGGAITSGRRVDVHQHAILPEYVRALERSGITENSALRTKIFTRQSILEVMDGLGMQGAVLLPFSSSGIHHGDDTKARYLTKVTNEAMARLVSEAPTRLGFYAILPLPDVDGALREMEHALDTLHADAVAFLTTQNGVYLGDRDFEEVYAEMNRRSVTAFLHPARPTYTLPLKLWAALLEYPFDTTRAAVNLIYNGIMSRYPNIRWILAHAGGALPYLSERLQALQRADREKPSFLERIPEGFAPFLKKFYYDVAMAGAVPPISALTAVAEPSHIFYGSDWPYVSRENISEQVVNMGEMTQMAGGGLAAIERGNAATLFPRFARRSARIELR